MRWFKMKDDIIFDPEIQSLTEAERWVWIVLLSFASRERKSGFLCKGVDEKYLERTTNTDDKILKSAIKKLINFGMLKLVKDRYYITNWKKYQSEYERVSKYKKDTKKYKKVVQRYGKEVDIEVDKKKNISPNGDKLYSASNLKKIETQYDILKGYTAQNEYGGKYYSYKRKRAKELLKECGSIDRAITCLDYFSKIFDEKKLEWTWETCIKRFQDFLEYEKSMRFLNKYRKEGKNV